MAKAIASVGVSAAPARIPWPEPTAVPGATGGPLPAAFFERDTREVARDLLGKVLLSRAGGVLVGGTIVEAEAYLGADDPGSHAATKGMTPRNAVMYGPPGHTYVYFTYGNHHMLNLVAESEGVAGGVLIRAVEPTLGIETMRVRRARPDRELTNGPGKLAAALGLDLSDNASRLGEGNVVVFEGRDVANGEVAVSGRIGLSAGHELHLRYFIKGNAYVSGGKPGCPSAARRRRRD